MILEITAEEEFYTQINSEHLVLVDFYADWCEPCKWLDTVLFDLVEKAPVDLTILKVNSELLIALTNQFFIKSVPVLVLFKEGKEVWRMNGFMMTEPMLQIISEFSRET